MRFPAFRKASSGISNITMRHIRIKTITKSHLCCSNILQCVGIWTKTVTTFQKTKCKNSERFRSWKNAFKKSTLELFYNLKRHSFDFVCFLEKQNFKSRILPCVKFWNEKIKLVIKWRKSFKTYPSLKNVNIEKWVLENITTWNDIFAFFMLLQKARFNVQNFTMRPIQKKLYNVSDFESNSWKRVRSWEKFPFKRSLHESCYSEKTTFFCIFLAFSECMN